MTKQRTPLGVTWTDPTGRTWLSPTQHQPPQPAVRPLPALRGDPDDDQPHDDDPDDPDDPDDGHTDTDPIRLELRAVDPHTRSPEQIENADRSAEQRRIDRLIHADALGWGIDLDNHTRW